MAGIDVGRFFRLQADFSPYRIDYLGRFYRISFSSGVALKVHGSAAKREGGLEVVVSVMAETGYIYGKMLEVGDGYSEDIKWFIVGPSAGIDLTYWFQGGIGFNASLKTGYLFRAVDMGSDYSGGYSEYDKDGFLDLALTLGVAL
jgi:hypothetical protein